MKFGLNNLPFLGNDNLRDYAQPFPTGMCAGLYIFRQDQNRDVSNPTPPVSGPLSHLNGVEIWPNAGPTNPANENSTIAHCIKADMNNVCQGKCANHIPCGLEESQWGADIDGPYHPTTPSGMSKLPRDPRRDCSIVDVNGRCFGPLGGVGADPDPLTIPKCPDHWMYMFQNPEDLCFNIRTFKTYDEEKHLLGIGSPANLPANLPPGTQEASCSRYFKLTNYMDWPTSTHCVFKKQYLIFANLRWNMAKNAQDGVGPIWAYDPCFGCPPWKTDQELDGYGGVHCWSDYTTSYGNQRPPQAIRINWDNQNYFHNCSIPHDLDHLYRWRFYPTDPVNGHESYGCSDCEVGGQVGQGWRLGRGCWSDRMALFWFVICQTEWQKIHQWFMDGNPTYMTYYLCLGYDPCVDSCNNLLEGWNGRGDSRRRRAVPGGYGATGGMRHLHAAHRWLSYYGVENCWEDAKRSEASPGLIWFPASGEFLDSAGCPQDISVANNYRVRYEWTEFTLDPLQVQGPPNAQVPVQPLTVEPCQNIAVGQHSKWLVHATRRETRTFLLHSGALDPSWIETGLLLPSLDPHNANSVKIPEYNKNFVREYNGVRSELLGGHLAAKEELWRDFNTLEDRCGAINSWQPEWCAYFEDPEGKHKVGIDSESCVGNWPAWSKVCIDYYEGERYIAQTNWICVYDTFNLFTSMIRRQPAFIGSNASNQIGWYSAGYDRESIFNENYIKLSQNKGSEWSIRGNANETTEPWQRGFPFIFNDNAAWSYSDALEATGFLCGLHFEWGGGSYEIGYTQGNTFFDKTGFQGSEANENCIVEEKYCDCGPAWRTDSDLDLAMHGLRPHLDESANRDPRHGAWSEGYQEHTGDFRVIKELTVYGPTITDKEDIGVNLGIDAGQMTTTNGTSLPRGIIKFGTREPQSPSLDGFSWSLEFTSHRLTDDEGCLTDLGVDIYQTFRNISEHSNNVKTDSAGNAVENEEQYYKQGIFQKYIKVEPIDDSRISHSGYCKNEIPGLSEGDQQALKIAGGRGICVDEKGPRSHIYAWIPRLAYSTGRIGGLWWHHMKKIGAPGEDLEPFGGDANGSGSWYHCSGLGRKAVQLFGAGKVGVVDFLNYKCGYSGDSVGPKFNWERGDFVRPNVGIDGFEGHVSGWSNVEWSWPDEASITGITDVVVRFIEKKIVGYHSEAAYVHPSNQSSRGGCSTPFDQDICYDIAVAIPASMKFNVNWDKKEVNENGFRGAGFLAMFVSGFGFNLDYQMGDYNEQVWDDSTPPVLYMVNSGFNPVGAFYHINSWNIWDHKPDEDWNNWWINVPGWWDPNDINATRWRPPGAQQSEYKDLFYYHTWTRWENHDPSIAAGGGDPLSQDHGNAPIHISVGTSYHSLNNLNQGPGTIDDYNHFHIDEIIIPLSGRTMDRSRIRYADEFNRSYGDGQFDFFGIKHLCGHRFIYPCSIEEKYNDLNYSYVWTLDPTSGWNAPYLSGFTNPLLYTTANNEWIYGSEEGSLLNEIKPQGHAANEGIDFADGKWQTAGRYKIYTSGSGLFEFPYKKDPRPGKLWKQDLKTQLISGVDVRSIVDVAWSSKRDDVTRFECPKDKYDPEFINKTVIGEHDVFKQKIKPIDWLDTSIDSEHKYDRNQGLPHTMADFRPIPFRYTIHLIKDSEVDLWGIAEDPPYFKFYDDGRYGDLLLNTPPFSFHKLFLDIAHMWRLGGYSIGNSDGYDIDLAGAISAIDFHGALQENRWNGHHLNLECADAMHYDMPDNQKKHYAAWYKYPANEDKIVGHSQHAYDRIQGSWHLQWMYAAPHFLFNSTPNTRYQNTCTTGHMTELVNNANSDLFYHRSGICLSRGGGWASYLGGFGENEPISKQEPSLTNNWDNTWVDETTEDLRNKFKGVAERASELPYSWPNSNTWGVGSVQPQDQRQPVLFSVSHPNRGFFGMKIDTNNCPDPVEVTWSAPTEECCWWTDFNTFEQHKVTPQYVGYKNFREKITVDVTPIDAPSEISEALEHQFVMHNSKWKEHCSYGRSANDDQQAFCGPEVGAGTGYWHNTEIQEVYVPIRIFKNYTDYDDWKPLSSSSNQMDIAYTWEAAYPHQMMFDYNPCEQWYPPIFKWKQESLRNLNLPSGAGGTDYPGDFDCNDSCCQFHHGMIAWNGTTTQLMWDAWPQALIFGSLAVDYPFDGFFGSKRPYEDPFSDVWGGGPYQPPLDCPHSNWEIAWGMPRESKRWDVPNKVKVGRYTLDLLTGITYQIEVNKIIEEFHPSGWRSSHFHHGCPGSPTYNDECRIHYDGGYIHSNSPCDGCKDPCGCGPTDTNTVASYPKKYAFVVGACDGVSPGTGESAMVARDINTFDVRGEMIAVPYRSADWIQDPEQIAGTHDQGGRFSTPSPYAGTISSQPASPHSTPAGATWLNLPYWQRGDLLGAGNSSTVHGADKQHLPWYFEYGSKCMPKNEELVDPASDQHVSKFVTLDMGILGIGPSL